MFRTLGNPALTSLETSMNTFVRLCFVALSISAFVVFVFGFTSLGKLSDSQNFMLWSLVPASLILFTASFHKKGRVIEIVDLLIMFVGLFLFLFNFGMYKQSDEAGFFGFAAVGIGMCASAVYYLAFVPMINFFSSRS